MIAAAPADAASASRGGGVAVIPVAGAGDVTVLAATVPAAPLAEDAAVLSPSEWERLEAFLRPADAAAYARAHALLRRVVGERAGCAPRDVALLTRPGHAPAAPALDLGCSIAHADGLVLVAVAPGRRVGVDVEAVDSSLSTGEMAWIERELLLPSMRDGARDPGGRSDDEARRRFLRRWTRHEAVLKALGTGFGGAVGEGDSREATPPWCVLDLAVGGGHVAALAVAGPGRGPATGTAWR